MGPTGSTYEICRQVWCFCAEEGCGSCKEKQKDYGGGEMDVISSRNTKVAGQGRDH